MGIIQKLTRNDSEKMRLARLVALGGGGDMHTKAVRGVTRWAKRYAAAGDPTTAAKLRELADKAAKLIAERDAARAACKALNGDAIADAIAQASADLVKRLPACFASLDEARDFASRLPLTAARAQATAQASAKNTLTGKATAAHRALAATLEAAGALALTDFDGVRTLRELALIGEE